MFTTLALIAAAAQSGTTIKQMSPPPPPPPMMAPPPPPPPVQMPDARPHVAITTDFGTIVVRLEDGRAPLTTANFLRYVDAKRMDGFKFYRTTRSWGAASQLIQAGNRGDARRNFPPVAHEPTNATGLTSCNGAVSMARLVPGDATTDFFVLLSDIKGFDAVAGGDPGFAVFGEMVSGREVAEKIYAAPVSETEGEGVMRGQILAPQVTIVSARRVPAPEGAPVAGCIVKSAG